MCDKSYFRNISTEKEINRLMDESVKHKQESIKQNTLSNELAQKAYNLIFGVD